MNTIILPSPIMTIIFSSLVICLGLAQANYTSPNPWKNPTLSGSIVSFPNGDEMGTEMGTVVFGNIIDKEANNYSGDEIVGDFLAHTLIDSNPIGLPVDCLGCTPIITDAVECSLDAFTNSSQFARSNASINPRINQDSSIDDQWKIWEVLKFDTLNYYSSPQTVFYTDANEEMIACALFQPASDEMAEEMLVKALNAPVYEPPMNTLSASSSAIVPTVVVGVVSMTSVTALLFA